MAMLKQDSDTQERTKWRAEAQKTQLKDSHRGDSGESFVIQMKRIGDLKRWSFKNIQGEEQEQLN